MTKLSNKKDRSATGIEVIRNELQALLTCSDSYTALHRAVKRTRPMLMKEQSLKKLWPMARGYNKYIKGIERDVPPLLDQLRKEMNHDPLIFSSENMKANDQPTALQDELLGDDQWAEDARNWLLSKARDIENLDLEDRAFMVAIRLRDFLKARSYSIGEHPVIALALFERLCERFNVMKLVDETPYSPLFRSETMLTMHRTLKELVVNLIAELPNIRSWGAFAVEGLNLWNLAESLARKIWGKNASLTRAEVAKRVHKSLLGMRKNCAYNSVYKWLDKIDPRSEEERRTAQHSRGGNLRKKTVKK